MPSDGAWWEHYYVYRDMFNEFPTIESPDRAALFIWINKACFNGLYRENLKGGFNVPIGSHKTVSLPSPEAILGASEALQCAALACIGFEEALRDIKFGDQVYADPPYIPGSKTANFIAYNKRGFTWDEQCRLAQLMREKIDMGADMVLSQRNVPVIRDMYKQHGLCVGTVQDRRSVSCKGSGRKRVFDLLVTGKAPAK